MNHNNLQLIIYPFYWDWEKHPHRGIDRYNYELVKGLRKRNIALDIIDWGYIENNIEAMVKEIFFPFRLLLKKGNLYHAVHAMGAKWAILLGKKPLVTSIQDMVPIFHGGEYDSAFKYFIKRWSIKIAIWKSDCLIVGYPSIKKIILENFKVDPNKIKIVPYGIDHNRFTPGTVEENRKQKRILFLGNATRAKGADSLIFAFQRLVGMISNVKLLIASEGHDLPYLKDLVRQLGLEEKVEFLGVIPEAQLADLYRGADIFVFPTRHGFNLPTVEAMACGIPTITGDTFDSADFVGDAGILINPDQYQEIADAMVKLLSDRKLWYIYRNRGIKKAKEFSWDRTVEGIIAIYNELLFK